MNQIAELLPEGLSEETLSQVADLVSSTIDEEVQNRMGLLEAKVNSFLRSKVDEMKEQAIAELEEENPVFRNARLFESVRTLMSMELGGEDENSAVWAVNEQKEELEQEISVLTEELNRLVSENEVLENTSHALSSKIDSLEEAVEAESTQKENLSEEIKTLEASQEKPFKSSEKALMVSENVDGNMKRTPQNEFLTNEVMKFMPFDTSKS